jgi:RecQ family ATP-dependent DNA helicase
MKARLLETIQKHWGYSSLRPLQEEAMLAALSGRDSLVVMPTGGGKSLCYQAPAIVSDRVTVVVSPLISLMKDQVDGLLANGIAAAQVNSSQSSGENRITEQELFAKRLKLLFVSPERLAMQGFRDMLRRANVLTFAIDEAHCISHWGHDFRPEYRQLRTLREEFPDASVHAYTATATPEVREDIARSSDCAIRHCSSATSIARTSPIACCRDRMNRGRCSMCWNATAARPASSIARAARMSMHSPRNCASAARTSSRITRVSVPRSGTTRRKSSRRKSATSS